MNIFNKQHIKSSLAITTTVGCRNSCSYCPQKVFVQSYKKLQGDSHMSFETFAACIKSVPRDICLSFSGFSEPWLNPSCSRMIIHAHAQGFMIRVNTTLIGMQADDIHQMKGIPFVKFVVHLPDDQELTRIRVDNEYLANMELLLKNPPQNLMWKFHYSPSGADIHPEVQELLQKYKARIKYFGLNSRAGKIDSGSKVRIPNHGQVLQECQDFHHNILLPNGDITLCHMDWGLKHILGNLLTMEYSDIHSAKVYKDLLEKLKVPEAAILCRECEKDNVKRTLPQQLILLFRKKISGEKNLY